MIEIKHSSALLAEEGVPFTTQPLRQGPMPHRSPAPSTEEPSFVRHLGSNAANGRLPGVLRDGEWRVKWSADLPAEPRSVIRSGDRILSQWSGVWRLFDGNGKLVHQDYCGRSPIVIDERSQTFQLITDALGWEVRTLGTGEMAFQNALPYTEEYSWPVLFRSGSKMVAFANIQPAFQHGAQEKSSALMQLIELGMPFETDASKLVKTLKRFETLEIAAENSRAAAQNGTVVMAAPDLLMRFDSNLKVAGAFTGNFRPRQISLDESEWAYLYVENNGARNIWTVMPDGTHAGNWTMPREVGDPIQAPILGYDRRVYVLSSSQVAALDAEARPLWVKLVPGGSVGAGVTINGHVLVTGSNSLLDYSPDGEHKVLRKFEETVTTPPIYTSHHEILLGAGKKLYCLAM